jgi:hypothetical protein
METNFETQIRFNDNNKEGKGETKKKKKVCWLFWHDIN